MRSRRKTAPLPPPPRARLLAPQKRGRSDDSAAPLLHLAPRHAGLPEPVHAFDVLPVSPNTRYPSLRSVHCAGQRQRKVWLTRRRRRAMRRYALPPSSPRKRGSSIPRGCERAGRCVGIPSMATSSTAINDTEYWVARSKPGDDNGVCGSRARGARSDRVSGPVEGQAAARPHLLVVTTRTAPDAGNDACCRMRFMRPRCRDITPSLRHIKVAMAGRWNG